PIDLMGGGMTSSDIKNGNFDCKKAALIFARGTGEPGNMGYVVGPGLGSSLKKAMNGDVLLQGADYSNIWMFANADFNLANFSGGGAKEMVTVVQTVMKKCPDTKIVLGGYSQGAMQVHQALASLGPDAAKIAAAVTFGDPY
ncbi:alpha/beta-hydrolase, partial [Tothia fuscella]